MAIGFRRKPWCFLRDSAKIRASIEMRIKERGMKMSELGRLSNITKQRLNRYFTQQENKAITQHDLLVICEILGIEIDVQIKYK